MAISEIEISELIGNGAPIVDVRERDEYAAGHVPGAVNVPLSEIADRARDACLGPVVHVICQAGGRSMRACEFLEGRSETSGVTFVNVAGGTGAWIASGFEVVVGDSPR